MHRKLLALLTALLVTSAAGLAISGGTASGPVELQDFDPSTGSLWGTPLPSGTALEFWHRPSTVHLPGPPAKQYPPSPCRGLAIAHDTMLHVFGDSASASPAMLRIVQQMAKFQCRAVVGRDTGGNLVSFQPTP